MIIKLNGKEKDIVERLTLKQLVESLSLNPSHVVAEVNEKIIKTPDWETLVLTKGDCVELVTFVGGG